MTLRAVSPSGTGGGGTAVPSGGTTGQVLGNTSGTPAWTTPNTPYLHVTLSANQNLTSGTLTLIAYDTKIADTGNYFNTTTHLYTPLIAGRYLVIASILGNYTVSSTGSIESVILKNGGNVAVSRGGLPVGGPTNAARSTTAVVSMNGTTDTLSAQVTITATTPVLSNTAAGTYLQIIYLGP